MKMVDAYALKEWLENGEAVVVDVRGEEEHAREHIAGSKLIPLGHISLKALPDLKGKKLVVHCGMGKRGGKACEKLLSENPKLEIYNLEGGITAWVNAGFGVKSI